MKVVVVRNRKIKRKRARRIKTAMWVFSFASLAKTNWILFAFLILFCRNYSFFLRLQFPRGWSWSSLKHGSLFSDCLFPLTFTRRLACLPSQLTLCLDKLTNMLSFDDQVLASIHQTVIPHLSNPAMLWCAYLQKKLLLFCILFPFVNRLLMFHNTATS